MRFNSDMYNKCFPRKNIVEAAVETNIETFVEKTEEAETSETNVEIEPIKEEIQTNGNE